MQLVNHKDPFNQFSNLVTVRIYLFLRTFQHYHYLHLARIIFFVGITFIYLKFM